MQGERWVDEVMQGLEGIKVPKSERQNHYNRIYEAVMRGNRPQGQALIKAIHALVDANRAPVQLRPLAENVRRIIQMHRVGGKLQNSKSEKKRQRMLDDIERALLVQIDAQIEKRQAKT